MKGHQTADLPTGPPDKNTIASGGLYRSQTHTELYKTSLGKTM